MEDHHLQKEFEQFIAIARKYSPAIYKGREISALWGFTSCENGSIFDTLYKKGKLDWSSIAPICVPHNVKSKYEMASYHDRLVKAMNKIMVEEYKFDWSNTEQITILSEKLHSYMLNFVKLPDEGRPGCAGIRFVLKKKARDIISILEDHFLEWYGTESDIEPISKKATPDPEHNASKTTSSNRESWGDWEDW